MMKSKRTTLFLALLCALLLPAARPLCATAATNALAPMTAGKVMVAPGDEYAEAPIRLTSYGTATAYTVTYSLYYTDTGESEGPVTVTLDTPIEGNGDGMFTVRLKPGKELAKTDVVLTLSHVNGQYNEVSVNYTYITRYTVASVPRKRVLVEDYTGMWCKYCPRGIAIMESLQRLYPDDFIGVAIHVGDKLATAAYDYETQKKWVSGYPSLWCMRRNKINSYNGLSDFLNERDTPSLLGVSLAARWDAGRDNISVTAEVTPCMEVEDGYALAYILTEDGMHDDSWHQANAPGEWNGVTNAPDELVEFSKYGSWIPGPQMTYNHVAIAAQGIGQGVENSLAGAFVPGEAKRHETSFGNVAQYGRIQKKENLSVCALVINTRSGAVENAAKCAVLPHTTGIGSTPLSAGADRGAPTVYYSLDGRLLAAPCGGVCIAVYADGSTRKVTGNGTGKTSPNP